MHQKETARSTGHRNLSEVRFFEGIQESHGDSVLAICLKAINTVLANLVLD